MVPFGPYLTPRCKVNTRMQLVATPALTARPEPIPQLQRPSLWAGAAIKLNGPYPGRGHSIASKRAQMGSLHCFRLAQSTNGNCAIIYLITCGRWQVFSVHRKLAFGSRKQLDWQLLMYCGIYASWEFQLTEWFAFLRSVCARKV